MKAVVGAGATFVAFVLGGFALGLVLGNRTGHAWWAIVGIFAGLFAGMAVFATQMVRAIR